MNTVNAKTDEQRVCDYYNDNHGGIIQLDNSRQVIEVYVYNRLDENAAKRVIEYVKHRHGVII